MLNILDIIFRYFCAHWYLCCLFHFALYFFRQNIWEVWSSREFPRTCVKQVGLVQPQSIADSLIFGYSLLKNVSPPLIWIFEWERNMITTVERRGFVMSYRISRPIRRSVICSLEILEKNNDECILILVIYWKKTGLLHTKLSNHNIIYSS